MTQEVVTVTPTEVEPYENAEGQLICWDVRVGNSDPRGLWKVYTKPLGPQVQLDGRDIATYIRAHLMEPLPLIVGKKEKEGKKGKYTEWSIRGIQGAIEPPARDSGGSQGQRGQSWQYTEAGQRFVQERMDRRTALMQALAYANTAPLAEEPPDGILNVADLFYDWLTQSSAGGEAHVTSPPSSGTSTPPADSRPSSPKEDTRVGEGVSSSRRAGSSTISEAAGAGSTTRDLAWTCPKCGSQARQQWQWKPDQNPEREKRDCFDCSWTSGWVKYGTHSQEPLRDLESAGSTTSEGGGGGPSAAGTPDTPGIGSASPSEVPPHRFIAPWGIEACRVRGCGLAEENEIHHAKEKVAS